jgi:hypothetical protein
MRSIRSLSVVLAAVPLLSAGCVVGIVDLDDGDGIGREEAQRTFTQTIPVSGQSALSVVGKNGTVQVEGVVGQEEVLIHAVRRVRSHTREDAEDHLDLLHVSVQAGTREIRVETQQPERPGNREYRVDYEITVPESWYAELINGNGAIEVQNLEGGIDVKNGNGEVVLKGLVGSSRVDLGNGSVDASVWLPEDGEVRYSVGNGWVKLSLQPNVSARLEARTGNGTITLSGLVLLDSTSTRGLLKGVLGTGGADIDLSVGNGGVEVRGR